LDESTEEGTVKYEITWRSKDENPRCEKIVLTINARNEQEAIIRAMNFLDREQSGAPVRALWECGPVVQV
jgi:hypothetical protein